MATAISSITERDWESLGAFPARALETSSPETADRDELAAQAAQLATQLAKARAFIRTVSMLTAKPAKVESIEDADEMELKIIGYEMALASLRTRAALFLARKP